MIQLEELKAQLRITQEIAALLIGEVAEGTLTKEQALANLETMTAIESIGWLMENAPEELDRRIRMFQEKQKLGR